MDYLIWLYFCCNKYANFVQLVKRRESITFSGSHFLLKALKLWKKILRLLFMYWAELPFCW